MDECKLLPWISAATTRMTLPPSGFTSTLAVKMGCKLNPKNSMPNSVHRNVSSPQGLTLVTISAQLELFCPTDHPARLVNVSWSSSS